MTFEMNPVDRLQAALNIMSMMVACGYVAAANDQDFVRYLYEAADLNSLERQWTYHVNTYYKDALA